MRSIQDILLFRGDISPFLVHLTRSSAEKTARQNLEAIIREKRLIAGAKEISDARYGGRTSRWSDDQKQRFFGAVCFSETPIAEVHCLLEIAGRAVNLEPYGLAFLKSNLSSRGVSPAVYLNNEQGKIDGVFQALFELHRTSPAAAELLLPLVTVFGLKVKGPAAEIRPGGAVDWRWEREWRLPSTLSPFGFTPEDVFIGFCPHDEIDDFERLLPGVGFIDPRRNMKWYSTKLIEHRDRLGMKHSVV